MNMKKSWKSLDYSLILPLILLCAFGLIMVYSASSIVPLVKGSLKGLKSDYFFLSQLKVMIPGFLLVLLIYRLRLAIFKTRLVILIIYTVVPIVLLLTVIKGDVVNGAKGWIFGVQPAEFTKLAVIIALSRFLAKKHEQPISYMQGIGSITLFLIMVLGLILMQKDLGTDLLIAAVIGAMFLCSGVSIKLLLKRFTVTGIVWGPMLYIAYNHVLNAEQKSRFTAAINPFADAEGDGFHLINSLIAISEGGVRGAGLGNSIQKLGFLPEPHTDFIMAIIAEELGIMGVLIVLVSLLTIILRSFQLARQSKDPFASFLAIGIGSMLAIQTFVNIGGVTGLLPLTGVPVPFISSGGSSLLVNLMSVGLLLNISAQVRAQETKPDLPAKPHLVVIK
jgi:cell division protein FtsW